MSDPLFPLELAECSPSKTRPDHARTATDEMTLLRQKYAGLLAQQRARRVAVEELHLRYTGMLGREKRYLGTIRALEQKVEELERELRMAQALRGLARLLVRPATWLSRRMSRPARQ